MEITFTRLDGRFVETTVTLDDCAVLATRSPGAACESLDRRWRSGSVARVVGSCA
jgi:hypothetical protein